MLRITADISRDGRLPDEPPTKRADPKRSGKSLLLICDYQPVLLESLLETLDYTASRELVLVRKRDGVQWRDTNASVIGLPIRVFSEEEPLGVASILSLIAYLIMAIVVGTIAVIKRRLDAILGVFAFPQGLVAIVIGGFTRRKVAILTDGGDVDLYLEKPLIRSLILICLRRATIVTALNRTKADRLFSLGIKTQMCPTIGINTMRFRYATIRERKRGSVLYVGRLSREKCLGTLLRACGILHHEQLPLELVVIGDGPLKNQVVDIATEMGIEGIVQFEGHVPHSEIHRFFQEAAVFVLPSMREGVSVSLLEAMSSGCLCIVSDIPDNRDVVHHMQEGINFRVSDEQDLANKLRWSLAGSARLEHITRNARLTIEQTYSLKAVAETLDDILLKL